MIPNNIVIFNLAGWGLRNRDNATMKMQIDHMQGSYPETLAHAFLINYPYVLWPVWNVVKMWLDPNVRQKVVFIEKGNTEELLNVMPRNALPVGVGGLMGIFIYLFEKKN